MPQPPDPFALHDATLASLQQASATAPPTTSTSTKRLRHRAVNREEAAPTSSAGPAIGIPTAIKPRPMNIVDVLLMVIKWAAILGWRLIVLGFNIAFWTMDQVTSGGHRYDQFGRRTD